ncbi:MAG: pesticin [Acidobacteriales bacterium]|nr:pesticin [Terriglobales bacterium]
MDAKPIIIKKYENRRLYDSTNSRYVNLDEVARMVQDGSDVQVLDAATGEDLTRLVLTQIIVEHAKGPNSPFPLDVLRQMVMASGRATQESALNYMRAILQMYQNAVRVMAPPFEPVDLNTKSPFAGAERPVAGPPPNGNGTSSGNSEVDELKRRLAELEAMVARLDRDEPRAAARRKPRHRG